MISSAQFLRWSISHPCDTPLETQAILTTGEHAQLSYEEDNNVTTFTNKRLILRDTHGILGKTVTTYSLPYKSIHMWSIANNKLVLWMKAQFIQISIKNDIDVEALNKLLAEHIL